MKVTVAQAMKSVEVCQMVSNLLRDICLYRFDPPTGKIYILASDDTFVSINQLGKMEFEDNDTEF
ncbi:MAG: hypothetical protein HC860_13130 [Alkalinema sp. RU_4_3]|nr:hypothetical protein [Alkalinema sp. RU_4_3]